MHVISVAAALLLLLPMLADAGVYKWIGTDSQIHYSDRPVSGAERVGIEVDRIPQPSETRAPGQEQAAELGPYNAFEILRPEQNQTFRKAEGDVELSLLVDPSVSSGYRLEILLNGNLLPGVASGGQIVLQGLPFGSHSLQARIRDDFDDIVAITPVVDFHLRKPLPETP